MIGASGELGELLISRLRAEDDEVRVVEDDAAAAARWQELGAYVASGSADDPDLIERAAQYVRTIVVLDGVRGELASTLSSMIEGAQLAGVGRVVLCAAAPSKDAVGMLGGCGLEHVVLATGRGPRIGRSAVVPPEAVAAAIDAADDLAGEPRLELDLTEPDAWAALNLTPP